MSVMRKEEHLRLGAQLTEHFEGRHGALVIELNKQVIDDDGKAKNQAEKIELADKLAVKRLADGVLPEPDACFEALALK